MPFSGVFRGMTLVELLFVLALLAVLGTVLIQGTDSCGGHVDSEQALSAARKSGYTNPSVITIERAGWAILRAGCEADDRVAFQVSAMGVQEQPVDLTVCCDGGLLNRECTLHD